MKRILIIKLGALGDVIIATAHIERILASYPEDEVWLLTGEGYETLFAAHPRLHTAAFPRKGVKAMLGVLAWILHQDFDAVYDLQGSERSAVMSFASRAPLRAGMGFKVPYTHHIHLEGFEEEHIFDRLNRLLESAGLEKANDRPVLPVGKDEAAAIADWISASGLEKNGFVLMHAGSSERWRSKRWPAAHFLELARLLGEQELVTVWIGDEADSAVNKMLASGTGIDATGQFSITGLCALGAQARFAVVNDSGPMHALSAAGIPVYAFFGPTDWRRHHAVGQRERVLAGEAECSPCYLGECPPERGHQCMRSIGPEQVMERLVRDGLV